MISLDNLVRTPNRFGIRSTMLYPIQGHTYLLRADGGTSNLSTKGSELVHVTKGEVHIDNGPVVEAGHSFFIQTQGSYVVQDGSEAISVRQAEDPGEGRVYVPGGHTDARRAIVDLSSTIKHFRIADQPNLELGHHYHAGFDELFHVTKGAFDIHFEHPDTKERKFYRVTEGQQVKVPLGVAHLVIPDPGMEMINVCSRPFSRDDLNSYRVDSN
jgi:mannose-6-phosphate isomerase-like protein (cupin superfamily)